MTPDASDRTGPGAAARQLRFLHDRCAQLGAHPARLGHVLHRDADGMRAG